MKVSGREQELVATTEWVERGTAIYWAAAVRRFLRAFRDPGVTIPGAVLLFIVLMCFLGPYALRLPSPNVGDLTQGLRPIGTPGHPLGTNNLGNDMLSRLLHGGQASILVGIVATGMGFFAGVVLGALAGVLGGIFEAAIMRIFDALYAFPALIIALAIAAYLGPSIFHTMIAIAAFTISGFGRLARAQTVRVRNFDYIMAARSFGVSEIRIVFLHVIPNIFSPLLSLAMFRIGEAMVAEAGLSYLGLGIQIPNPSWGNLISSGQPYLTRQPSLLWLPSLGLFCTVLAITLLSDGLRRRLAQSR